MAYLFIALTILLTVYGQLVLKWQVGLHQNLISQPFSPLNIAQLLIKPWVMSAFLAAFGASLCWMAAISRLPLSRAYPFMAINFFLIALMAAWLFREQLDAYKIAGTAIIMMGVFVLSRSAA
ncbi:EamA family transporter [Stenotrophomonas maltophilia]|uniref:EamA family transporter n=1 Tax=Stenotrophomonas maltophilia TaxID=40324 RepID=UPI0005B71A62|nr:EamA family transporter [Stenotrophomonas maltophilia]KIS40184.1 4-amino-4-deoxy-L-arabinose-phosphoundecaprenol flippase subunit ArnF [Stenotrophomonas maltophilia WJ66]MCF3459261.1 EamA family transporter [Stenotrophomonas maltophilia]MCF3516180.1 EamA family transporter [Stenotrophomonas maltophilia]NYB79142.1 EamA family transporter [Stenotrophomonas maltophilia]